MTSRTRRLAYTAGFVVLVALTLWSWVPTSDAAQDQDSLAPMNVEPGAPEVAQSPADSIDSDPGTAATSVTAQPTGKRQRYAIGLHDISGLPADSPPGTIIDLWVAVDPPHVERSQIHPLISAVVVEEIQPPAVPEGPVTVILSVRPREIEHLLWADRYGALSAVLTHS